MKFERGNCAISVRVWAAGSDEWSYNVKEKDDEPLIHTATAGNLLVSLVSAIALSILNKDRNGYEIIYAKKQLLKLGQR